MQNIMIFSQNPIAQGLAEVFSPTTLVLLLLASLLGMLVGLIPGITATMAIALASSFTLTLSPVQGLAVLITIYVAAQYGDRIPAILVNTPGTPSSISSTFDGYPLAQQGKAGIALTSSAIGTGIGLLCGTLVLAIGGIPLAQLAMQFGPAEMFALVLFGMTMMVGVSTGRIFKGFASAVFGLSLAVIGRDPITGAQRYTFGILELNGGVTFIAFIIGVFGVAEVLNQIITYKKEKSVKAITQTGKWFPDRSLLKRLIKPIAVGSATGSVVGLVPAVGGDIAGIIGWENARKVSKHKEEFGKGSIEGLTAGDTSSAAVIGGSVTTTMALGVPGDAVMAVMLGSMLVWGLQPGPSLFANQPELVWSIVTIMIIATILTLVLNMFRIGGVTKMLNLPKPYLWIIILVFCVIGTFAVNNNVFDVVQMLIFGLIGLFMIRFNFPAGPAVLGLILGPLMESNLRRTLLISGWDGILTSPIAMGLIIVAIGALLMPVLGKVVNVRKVLGRKKTTSMNP